MKYNIFFYKNLNEMNNKKVVIFGCTDNAREFALRLLREEIRFDYFLQPYGEGDEYELPVLYSKQIISITECRRMDDFVIICPYIDLKFAKAVLCEAGLNSQLLVVENVHPYIKNSDNVIIYGMGGGAHKLYQKYGEILNVKYFVDSKSENNGMLFENCPVLGRKELKNLAGDSVVIIASVYYRQIAEELVENVEIESDHIFRHLEGGLRLNEDLSFVISEGSFKDILFTAKKKKLLLYGYKCIVESLERKFNLLDIPVQTLVRKSEKEDGTIYDLIYKSFEDTMFVITDGYSLEGKNKIREAGISEKDVIWAEDYSLFRSCREKYMLDPILGVTPENEDEGGKDRYYGFKEFSYKKENKKPLVILTLGGSTTAAYFVREKTWSEKLSDLLKEKGIAHIIYCGGMHSYTASGELLKFIRDGIWMQPDIVLSYSGVNNLHEEITSYSEQRFISNYLGDLYEKTFISSGVRNWNTSAKVYYGINPDIGRFEYWLSQEKMMHAICDCLNINFRCFLQPMLFTKRNYCVEDAEVIVKLDVFWNKIMRKYQYVNNWRENEKWNSKLCSAWESIVEHAYDFRNKGEKIDAEWFVNLSGLFDDVSGVYMDEAHVYEWGNQMIAEKIYDAIEQWLQ